MPAQIDYNVQGYIPRRDCCAGPRSISVCSMPSSQASSRSDSHMVTAPHAFPLAPTRITSAGAAWPWTAQDWDHRNGCSSKHPA